MNEKVATGAFIPTLNITFGKRLHDNASVMSAELNAMIMALEYLKNDEFMIVDLPNIIV